MRQEQSSRKQRGQALVETALLAMLLFFLLSAAVDLGLIFFSYQAVANAAQEGASYGSMAPEIPGCMTGNCIDVNSIRTRVRNEATRTGLPARVSVVNLRDLDNDRIDFTSDDDSDRIEISVVENEFGNSPGADCNPPVINTCEIIVKVTYTYKPFFFLAPAIGLASGVDMSATRRMTIRDVTSYEDE